MAAQTMAISQLSVSSAPVNLLTASGRRSVSSVKIRASNRTVNVVRMEAASSSEDSQSFAKSIVKHTATLATIAAITFSFGGVDPAMAALSPRQEGRNTVLENLNTVKDAAEGKFGETADALNDLVPEAPGMARSSSGSITEKANELKAQVSKAGGKVGEQADKIGRSTEKVVGDLAVKADADVPQEGTVVGGAPTPGTVAQSAQKLAAEYERREEIGGSNKNEEKLNNFFGNVLGGPAKEAKEQVGEAFQEGVEGVRSQLPGQ